MISVFKTNIGAFISIIVCSLLIIYGIYKFKILLNYENTSITKGTFYKTLAHDLSPRNISTGGFDMAYGVVNLAGDSFDLEEYFNVNIY